MTPYEKTTDVTVETNDDIVPIPLPGRCVISRVAIVRTGEGGDITADFYNRAFTSDAVKIETVTNSGGKTRVQFAKPFPLRVGDRFLTSGILKDSDGSSYTEYNGAMRVTAIVREPGLLDRVYVTDCDYAANGHDGTGALEIPTDEQPLYKALDQLTGTDNAEAKPEAVYHNQDPLGNLNIGVKRFIYVKFADAGDYRVSFRTYENVGH